MGVRTALRRAGTVVAVSGMWCIAMVAIYVSAPGSSHVAASSGAAAQSRWLLAVDGDGAVIADSDEYIGVSRAGSTVWRDASEPSRGSFVTCSGQCPAVVFNASLDSVSSSQVPDPAPRVAGGAGVDGYDGQFRFRQFQDDAVMSVRMVRGDETSAASQVQIVDRATAATRTVDLTTAQAMWTPGSAGDAGVVTLDNDDDRTGQLFVDVTDGRIRTRQVDDVVSSYACVGPAGAVLSYETADGVVVRAGSETSVLEGVSGGSCAAGARGVLVAEYTLLADGPRSRLLTVVAGQDPVELGTYGQEVAVGASPVDDVFVFVFVVDRAAEVVDASGATRAHLEDVDAAMFTAGGQLVTVSTGGAVSWHGREEWTS